MSYAKNGQPPATLPLYCHAKTPYPVVDCRASTRCGTVTPEFATSLRNQKAFEMSNIDFSKTHMTNWLSQQNHQRSRKTGPSAVIAVAILAVVVYAGYSL